MVYLAKQKYLSFFPLQALFSLSLPNFFGWSFVYFVYYYYLLGSALQTMSMSVGRESERERKIENFFEREITHYSWCETGLLNHFGCVSGPDVSIGWKCAPTVGRMP
jgi:hypothetical protein